MEIEDLVNSYDVVLMNLAIRYGVPSTEVEDIIQESWIAYYIKYPMNLPEKRMKAILMGIARNKCMDYHRKYDRVELVETISSAHAEYINERLFSDPLQAVMWWETLEEIKQAIQKLNRKYREIIILHVVEGRSIEEVCGLLKISKVVFYNRYYHVKLRINKIIKKS